MEDSPGSKKSTMSDLELSPLGSSPLKLDAESKVKALLADLGESSDEDRIAETRVEKKARSPTESVVQVASSQGSSKHMSEESPSRDQDAEDEDEEDDIVFAGGRLAARLNESRTNTTVADPQDPAPEATSADETTFRPMRKLLLSKKRKITTPSPSPSQTHHSSIAGQRQSPSSNRSARSISLEEAQPDEPQTEESGKSRFKALVEKHRAARLAREEAENAKRAARAAQQSSEKGDMEDQNTTRKPAKSNRNVGKGPKQARQTRGSSPARASSEDSDLSDTKASRTMTDAARPTRKASRKALEEMNRETQRMSRNMQLAHQIVVKRKFSKADFFKSFGVQVRSEEPETMSKLADSSSIPVSDEEMQARRLVSTPPTSPLIGPLDLQKDNPEPNQPLPELSTLVEEDDDFSLPQIIAQQDNKADTIPLSTMDKGKGKATDSPESLRVAHAVLPSRPSSMSKLESKHDSSDSELDIISAVGHKRKYAAFENLPRKRIALNPSHVALRNLAGLNAPSKHDPRSKNVSNQQMTNNLMLAARRQAQEERAEKIENLKARGVVIKTEEEKEKEEEEVEDLVEKFRAEDDEIRRKEREDAKRDSKLNKNIDDSDDEEDEDFAGSGEDDSGSSSSSEEEDEGTEVQNTLVDEVAEESELETQDSDHPQDDVDSAEHFEAASGIIATPLPARPARRVRIVVDDDDEDEEDNHTEKVMTPALPAYRTPQTPATALRSARRIIPGFQQNDDSPIGLTQAFAATMAESQGEGGEQAVDTEQDGLAALTDLPAPTFVPTPGFALPSLQRLESADIITESIPGTQPQTQGFDVDLRLTQTQAVPESPSHRRASITQVPPSQPIQFTQDVNYQFSPFLGNRFAETPRKDAERPHSTEDTVLLDVGEAGIIESPSISRKPRSRLQRGRAALDEEEEELEHADEKEVNAKAASSVDSKDAFARMAKAAKREQKRAEYDRKRSEARNAVEEAAEESDDEYAGLGGLSDEDSGSEDEADRAMIDTDANVGEGDESTLAKLHADRERADDEAGVAKLLKDITTGALRRKRGVDDDLDLSDEEDAIRRRREQKRREFAKMRRELLKDEAVGKIADDKKKAAFLKSIEDREADSDDDVVVDEANEESQDVSQSQVPLSTKIPLATAESQDETQQSSENNSQKPLRPLPDSELNIRRKTMTHKPTTLAQIRESVSFLIEEPDSQANVIDLGLSDSEEEPEAYVNLDRHFREAENEENALEQDGEDLGDFIVADQADESQDAANFKLPALPIKTGLEGSRKPFNERRTKPKVQVVDRLELLRQASSSSASTANTKMAFGRTNSIGSLGMTSLLRRATTNGSVSSMPGRENMSATGVVVEKERGSAKDEKEFIRKGSGGIRNAVNYRGVDVQQGRKSLAEEKMSARAGVGRGKKKGLKKGGFLGGLLGGGSWDS